MKTPKPKALTPEAQREKDRFHRVYQAGVQRAKRVALSILVWGSSPTGDTPVARKRRQIRDELLELGHNAMFSEDIELSDKTISEKSKEYAQASAADLILILIEDSAGALAEAHDFCNDPEIAPKVLVFAPRRYRRGYSARGALKDLEDAYGGVVWYGDNELTACEVCSKAIRRAEALRQIRVRGGAFR